MAKVSTAKAKITAYLKAKGVDTADIKDAFDELDTAETDLNQLADALQKNEQWTNWYQTAQPEIQKIVQERDSYKGKLDKLQQAGLTFEQAQAVAGQAPGTVNPPAATQTQDSNTVNPALARALSDTMKDLIKLNFRHFKEFGSEADLDAMEKLMEADPQTGRRKAYTADEAYRLWSEPMYTKKREEDVQRKIDEGVKAGVAAELAKVNTPGVRKFQPKKDKDLGQVETAQLDKPSPGMHELRSSFAADWDEVENRSN